MQISERMKYFLSYYCEITVLSIRFEIAMKKKVLKIAIIDADLLGRKKHRFPNLACEKISGYWKAQGVSVELKLDYEGLDQYNKVFISKVFTDTPVPEGVLDLPNVEYGGTGFFFDKAPDLPCEIEHHMPDYHLYDDFINSHIEAVVALEATEDDKEAAYKHMRNEFKEFLDYSIGFVTRGCFRKCGFCVNKKYDRVFEHSPLSEFYDPSRPKICLLDDNFFGHPNWSNILQTLQGTGRPFKFKQGLDERLLTDEKCELLCKSKYDGDIDLFMFAMAIGLKERKKTPLSASHGFILESYISGNDFAKMFTLLVDELRRTNEEEKIGDKDAAFRIAQEYANTGFQVIQGWVETRGKKDEDALVWELISDLEEKFATCFPGED